IRDFDAVDHANKEGIGVIITDHHEPLRVNEKVKIPQALAVINPKIEKIGQYLSGSGVAFLVILGLLMYYFYTEIDLYTIFHQNENNIVQLVKISNFVPKVRNFSKNEFLKFINSGRKGNFIFLNINHLNSTLNTFKGITNIINNFFLLNDIIKSFGIDSNFDELLNRWSVPTFLDLPQKISKILFLIHILGKREIKNFIDNYLPLVGLTVLSDNMGIISYNKFFVEESVKRLSKVQIDGIRFLISSRVMGNDTLKIRNLTMNLIPFMNSAGRMGKGKKVVELLLENDLKNIEVLFDELKKIDELRKNIFSRIFKEFYDRIKNNRILISESIEKGLISLLSTKVAMDVDYPIVVISNGGNGELFSGSARFRKGDMFSMMKLLSHHFENFGGHKKAVGFVIPKNNIDNFVNDFLKIDYKQFVEKYDPIMEISIFKFKEFANLLYSMEPLNDDLRPVFEDEVVIEDFKKDHNSGSNLVKIGNNWILAFCSDEILPSLIGRKAKIIFSYEFRFSSKLQDDLFIPKILEISNG
ncbi:MAG: DHHA1 domain-containing protein, partial [Brevinematia bacterium]